MSKVFIPENYHSQLNLIETEVAIKMIKDYFERRLSEELRLTRVSAPLFLLKNTGLIMMMKLKSFIHLQNGSVMRFIDMTLKHILDYIQI